MHPKSHLCELTTTQMTKRLTFFGKDELMLTKKVAEKSAGQIWMFDTEKEVFDLWRFKLKSLQFYTNALISIIKLLSLVSDLLFATKNACL